MNEKISFQLLKYAYFVGESSKPQISDEWKVFDGSHADLHLSITGNHHLLVTMNQTIMENMSMWNAASWLKAFAKSDSMLFVNKQQENNRQFKVKFKGVEGIAGAEMRKQCTEKLRKYFQIAETDKSSGNQKRIGSESDKDHKGEISIGKMAQILTKEVKANLPSIYSSTPIPTDSLESLVSLCLTDTNFPAFVEDVDKQLHNLMDNPDK